MEVLLRWSQLFFEFFTNTVVPFFTETPESLTTFIYIWGPRPNNVLIWDWHLHPIEIPWLFGDISIGQLILTVLIPAIVVIRLVKTLWDALPFA